MVTHLARREHTPGDRSEVEHDRAITDHGTNQAIMFTITTYGTWLRGDMRGWVDDGITFPPDPVLEQFDAMRMRHPAFKFSREVRLSVGEAIGAALTTRLQLTVYALCVQSWHSHFVTGACAHDVAKIVKCAKDAARWCLRINRPIWAEGYDKRFCFDHQSVANRIAYVERHNLQDGLSGNPWSFVGQSRADAVTRRVITPG